MKQYGDIGGAGMPGKAREVASSICLQASPDGAASVARTIIFNRASHPSGEWLGAFPAPARLSRRFVEAVIPVAEGIVSRLKLFDKASPAKGSILNKAAGARDLKKISGIGPRLEKVLKKRGVTTYRNIETLVCGRDCDVERRVWPGRPH
ncbi:hypothetical protein [Aquamicrobium zhengzhouense]|uniref:Helix-hairpin-helix domain-containing protein n=1 Tax=Aquamicrobium zhengzhouense TaxID=2781738 RepID=A0ABS0SCX2_9HYPH|nr:hypothetical protein [Aquamicrobium zhengzhouense]MBI1620619.1 hypothetical protein [Aquamicrobium zhengzhouense]